MTISLWHCIIINFTSLAWEGVYNRLSLFKVLTQSHAYGNLPWDTQPTTDKPIAIRHQQLATTDYANHV